MITTRQINVNLDKGRIKLRRMTTKDVDASIKVVHPKEPVKAQSVSTTTISDVTDIAEKKRRDEIMTERKKTPDATSEKMADEIIERLWMKFVFTEFDGLIQAVSRRELK